jgi:hypothetical protein
MCARLSSQVSSPSPGPARDRLGEVVDCVRAPRGSCKGGRLRRQQAAIARGAIDADVHLGLVQVRDAEHLLELREGFGKVLDRVGVCLLEARDRLVHAPVVGVNLPQDHVGLDHVAPDRARARCRPPSSTP